MAGFIEDADVERIEAAIRAAERRTRAEFVCVVARASDDYRFIPLLWAALAGLAAPTPFSLGLVSGGAWIAHATALATFVGVALVLQVPALKRLAVPGAVKRSRAARAAHEQFLEQRLHMTDERTGVLLFVSAFEHHVEIVADDAAAAAVPEAEWARAITAFVAPVRAGRTAEGFLAAIDVIDGTLARSLPAAPGDRDELPNALVLL